MNFDFLSPFLGTMSQVHMTFVTWLRGQPVGHDSFGNQYYETRKTGTKKRWVIYAGRGDASEIPPEWHAWMHRQTDSVPASNNPLRRPWQRAYQPNATGTAHAYLPSGSQLSSARRAPSSSDYQAWRPT